MNRDRPETLKVLRSRNEPARFSGLFRVKFLAMIARCLGITFKVDGLPYGAIPTNSLQDRSANHHRNSCNSTSLARVE